jgi:hypothetical protein
LAFRVANSCPSPMLFQTGIVARISINADQQGETSGAILAKQILAGELDRHRRAPGMGPAIIGLFEACRTRAEDVR